jgi:hypothetical protein
MVKRINHGRPGYYPKITGPKPAWLSGFIFSGFLVDN